MEEKNEHGGYLSVCIGDALSPDATVEGGFAGKLYNIVLFIVNGSQYLNSFVILFTFVDQYTLP